MPEKKNNSKPTEQDNHDARNGCIIVLILVVIIAVVIGGCHACSRNSNNSSSKPTTAQIAKKKAKARKKAKKQKEEKEDLAKLQSDLKIAPKKTDNLVTKASLHDSCLWLTLNEKAESGTDAQLKTLCREAWNYGAHMYNYYKPFPQSKWGTMNIIIQDPAGNELAKTNAMWSFEYEGNK